MPPKAKRADLDLSRLALAIGQARLALRRFREERREAVRQFVGRHWSDEGSREAVPVNIISLYASVVGRSLIAKNPRFMLSTMNRAGRPTVAKMQDWMNDEVEEMDLAQTGRRVVLDALFSVGIAKVALATPADAASVGWGQKVAMPFVERVDLDDWVADTHARDFSECSFVGHRLRVPLDVIRDSSLYSKRRKDLQPSDDKFYNREGDERINVMGRTYYGSQQGEWEDWIDIWELYLPRHKLILTIEDEAVVSLSSERGSRAEPLQVKEWVGPDSGPYHFLSYQVVPGNLMPKGPIMDVLDPHLAVNNVYRKLIRQAERMKSVTLISGGATEDGNRIQNANDGDMVKADNPDAARQIAYGGPDQTIFLFGQHMKDVASWVAGNLDIMGGLSPQSRTATQDKMLNENSSRAVADMQETTVTWMSLIGKAMGWFYHHHPTLQMRTRLALPGAPHLAIDRVATPQDRRQIPWSDLRLKVDPYSLKFQTPESRLQALVQVLSTIQPFMGLAQQQGIGLDLNALLLKMGKYMDLPDLSEILSVVEPPDQQAGPSTPDQGGGMPAETTRNYVRRSLGGDSAGSKRQDLTAQLMSANGNGMRH